MKTFIIVIITSLIIICVGFLLYFTEFSGSYSSDSSKWSDFASFNGYFLDIITFLILGFISFITYNATNHFNKLQTRPLLYLTIDSPVIVNSGLKVSWYVINGASYPAINLLVRYTFKRDSEEYTKWVSCTSLSGNDKKELFWIHWADKIEICYSDLTDERFYLLEYLDHNAKTTSISKKKYYSNLNKAIANKENNIISLRDKFEKYFQTQKRAGNENPIEKYDEDFIKPHLFKK